MGHQFKQFSPCGAFGSFLDLDHFAEIVEKNTQRRNRVIENVLSLSRRQASPESIQLAPWLNEWARDMRQSLSLNEAQLTLALDPGFDTIHADPTHTP